MVGYREWNDALCDWFFRPEFAGQPVYLSCDWTVPDAVAGVHQWPVDDPVDDLLSAVRTRTGSKGPLEPSVREAIAWLRTGSNGSPPWVAVLAATVLAAAGSTHDSAGLVVSERAYYAPLRRLLGLPPGNRPEGFDNDIQMLWTYLERWLDGTLAGSRGQATATSSTRLPHVGWALSQTTLSAGDRARLPSFFRAIRAEPGEQIADSVLVASYLRWVVRHPGRSTRLKSVTRDSPAADLLAKALHHQLLLWDGRTRDERGRTSLPLLLTYYYGDGRLRLATRVADGFEHRTVIATLGTEAGEVELGGVDEFVQVPGGTAEALAGHAVEGQLVSAPGSPAGSRTAFRMRLPVTDVHVLRTNPELGMWAEVSSATFGEEHVVVVRSASAPAAARAMADLGGAAVPLRRAKLPAGWSAYHRFEPTRPAAVPDNLSPLLPSGNELAELTGGLPLDRRTRVWLTGGEPDVVLPEVEDRAAQVLQLDGHALSWPPSGPLVLRGQGLAAGPHQLVVAGRSLRFSLADEGVDQDGRGDVRRTVDRRPVQRQVTACVGADSPSGTEDGGGRATAPLEVPVTVCGASVAVPAGASDPLPPPARRRLIAGTCYYALGDPGQAARLRPVGPAWLSRLDPPVFPRDADLEAALTGVRFTAQWLLHVPARAQPTVTGIHGANPDPDPAPAGQPPAEPVNWDQVASHLDEALPSVADGAWDAYLKDAQLLVVPPAPPAPALGARV